MIGWKRLPRVPAVEGFCWPMGAGDTPEPIGSTFGPRRFPYHVATVGYDYDFHRGCDIMCAAGEPVYSVVAGPLTRATRTHFGWERAEQLNYWTETDAANGATFDRVAPTVLRVVGSRVGSQTFPTCARFASNAEFFDPTGGRWGVRLKFNADPTSIAGGVLGMGIWDPATNQYVAVEYDGTTVTARGTGTSGALSVDGTNATATPTYLDMYYTTTDDTLKWRYGDDQASLSNIATRASFSTLITNKARQCWVPLIYWRSTDSNAGTNTFDIDWFGWFDLQSVAKFGNWTQINGLNHKVYQLHFQDLVVERGQIVESGQLLGYAGMTGFDETSGPNIEPHVHVEYSSLNNFYYNDYEGQNMLKAGLMPRTNVSNNVAVVVDSANDPDGVDSHRMTVTIQRADQDFDANEFHLVGNTTSRTVNFDTSVGIHPTNWRIPKYNGVYITVSEFDEDATELVLTFYFNKATVGSTLVSAYVKDCNGNTLWATP